MCSNVNNNVPFPPFFIGHLEDVPIKVRVIGIHNCLDSVGVDISKEDCSSRNNVVRRGQPCYIYSKAIVLWLKTK